MKIVAILLAKKALMKILMLLLCRLIAPFFRIYRHWIESKMGKMHFNLFVQLFVDLNPVKNEKSILTLKVSLTF